MNWITNLFVTIAISVGFLFGAHSQPVVNRGKAITGSTTIVQNIVQNNLSKIQTPPANVLANLSAGVSTTENIAVPQRPVGLAQSTGIFRGKASIALDCNITACAQISLTSLGIVVRGNNNGEVVTITAFKFNSDGSFNIILPIGTYYIYEDNNNWSGTSLAATYSGAVTSPGPLIITSGNSSIVNIVIDNIKPNLPI